MTSWTHVAEGSRQINWRTNEGLSKKFLRSLVHYYIGQFGVRWPLAAINEALRSHGYEIVLRKLP